MRITALEIKQKTFEKGFRGYEKTEVQAFLDSLAREWERMQGELRSLKTDLDQSKKELKRLREVEEGLLRTFRTAEDTRTQVIEQGNKKAELQLKEAEVKGDAIVEKAKVEARRILEEAEKKGHRYLQNLQQRKQKLQKLCASLENHREQLMTNFRVIANDLTYKVDKLDKARLRDLETESMPKSTPKPAPSSSSTERPTNKSATITRKPTKKTVTASLNAENKDAQSFFDELEL